MSLSSRSAPKQRSISKERTSSQGSLAEVVFMPASTPKTPKIKNVQRDYARSALSGTSCGCIVSGSERSAAAST